MSNPLRNQAWFIQAKTIWSEALAGLTLGLWHYDRRGFRTCPASLVSNWADLSGICWNGSRISLNTVAERTYNRFQGPGRLLQMRVDWDTMNRCVYLAIYRSILSVGVMSGPAREVPRRIATFQ